MMRIGRILCPIDFSDFSRRALDHAVTIARWYESTITLLHVCSIVPPAAHAPGSGAVPSARLTPEDREALLASMRRFAEGEVGANVAMEFEIAEGPAAGVIVAKTNAMPVDLLVLGTHGRSGFERLVLGSVTEKVLRKAACPVLSVPRNAPDAVPIPTALFKRILCAVDFSDCSMRALDYALSLAQEADAHLTVIHVTEVPTDVPREVHENVPSWTRRFREYAAQIEQDRRARLADAIPEPVRAYCTVETVFASGTPYREILRVASEEASDLIVIGVRGSGAADRFFFGSTAHHVVRQATCPVLTLRTG